MRINEAYEHTAMASHGMDSTPSCPVNGCDRTVVQCVDISAPVTLSPNTSIGTPTATCQGQPTVTCTTDAAGTSCEVIMTQQVCVSIPVQYKVELTPGQPAIACAGDSCQTGGCGCGK